MLDGVATREHESTDPTVWRPGSVSHAAPAARPAAAPISQGQVENAPHVM